jgi:hypothetical protein
MANDNFTHEYFFDFGDLCWPFGSLLDVGVSDASDFSDEVCHLSLRFDVRIVKCLAVLGDNGDSCQFIRFVAFNELAVHSDELWGFVWSWWFLGIDFTVVLGFINWVVRRFGVLQEFFPIWWWLNRFGFLFLSGFGLNSGFGVFSLHGSWFSTFFELNRWDRRGLLFEGIQLFGRLCLFGVSQVIDFPELKVLMCNKMIDFLVLVDLNRKIKWFFVFNFIILSARVFMMLSLWLTWWLFVNVTVSFELIVLFLVDEVEFEHFAGLLFDKSWGRSGSHHLVKVWNNNYNAFNFIQFGINL